MKIFTTDNIRLLGIKLIKGLIVFAGIVASVILVFSLGSWVGEFFSDLLN